MRVMSEIPGFQDRRADLRLEGGEVGVEELHKVWKWSRGTSLIY